MVRSFVSTLHLIDLFLEQDGLVTIAYNGREAKFIFAAGTETNDVHDTIRTEFSMEPWSSSPFVLRTANCPCR